MDQDKIKGMYVKLIEGLNKYVFKQFWLMVSAYDFLTSSAETKQYFADLSVVNDKNYMIQQ